jgi:ion channel-forming bestrophin family protein
MKREKFHWFRIALQLRGSVIPSIWKRVVLCGFFGFLVSIAHALNFHVANQVLGTIIPSIVLGLLLVFRTNTAYERFWEGRKCWGALVTNTRNLARQIWLSIAEIEPEDRARKIAAMRLLVAFAVATKLQLRGESVNAEIEDLLSQSQYYKLKTMNNPPLEVAFWIGDYLQLQAHRETLNPCQISTPLGLLNNMVEALGGCERILRTPMPLAYAIHLKQLLLLYCFLLPFQIVEALGFWTGPIIALVSFTLFGIEAIGIEIENPFGYDANDLPLDAICATMRRNIEDIISLTPSVGVYEEAKLENTRS